MAKRIKKQIYSFQKLGIELFNIFEYIQTYSQFPKSFFTLYLDIHIFNYSIQLNIFNLIHFIQKSVPELYSVIHIFNNHQTCRGLFMAVK